MILQPDRDGNIISNEEFRNFFCLLVAAGNDTTRYSIAAGIQALCHQKDLLEQMRAGGKIWETASDEIIRWATPATYFRRTVTKDFEVRGKQMREGDKVLFWFISANRDENVFKEPFKVNLMRDPNKPVSYTHLTLPTKA